MRYATAKSYFAILKIGLEDETIRVSKIAFRGQFADPTCIRITLSETVERDREAQQNSSAGNPGFLHHSGELPQKLTRPLIMLTRAAKKEFAFGGKLPPLPPLNRLYIETL